VFCGKKMSAVKSETGLGGSEDNGREVEGRGGLGGGIDVPLNFLDSGLSTTDGGFDSKIFESEKSFEEIKDVPEHAA